MYPAWDLPDHFVDMVLRHQWLGAAALALPALILFGGLITRYWSCLLETSPLRRKVVTGFRKALQFVRRHCELVTVTLAGLAFLIIDPHFAGSPCTTIMDLLLGTSLQSPIAQGLSLVAIISGGVILSFAKTDSQCLWAGIIFGMGVAIGAVNLLSISIVQN